MPTDELVLWLMRRAMMCLAILTNCAWPASAERPPRVFFIGLDGATWTVMRPLLEQGRLPNLKSLIDRGSSGVLHSIPPMHSPSLWTTMATGVAQEHHGINDFYIGDRRTSSHDRKVKAIWNIVSDKGRKVAVVGYLASWPAETVAGAIISDQTLNLAAWWGKTYPDDVLKDYGAPAAWEPYDPRERWRLDRFVHFHFSPDFDPKKPDHTQQSLVARRLDWAFLRDESFTRISEYLLPRIHPDFFAIHIWGIDNVSHGFWKFAYPGWETVSNEDRKKFGEIVPKYYEYADEVVGRLLKLADSNTTILVASDHGFREKGQEETGVAEFLSGSHDPKGVVIVSGPGVKHGTIPEGASVLDICPTLLYFLDLPAGEDMPGHIWTDIVQSKYLKAHPPSKIASYGANPLYQGPTAVGEKVSEEEIRLLKSLGYLK